MIVILGTSGRLKGLPIIYVTDDEKELKKISARIIEILKPIDNISEDKILQDIVISYDDSILFFKQILDHIAYVSVFYGKNQLLPIKQWIYDKEQSLKELFHD